LHNDAAGSVLIVGGTSGIGLRMAELYAARGADVVITGRDADRCERIAVGIGGAVRGLALDLAEPATVGERLRDVGAVRALVLAAIERDVNAVRDYDLVRATRLVTLKLVGYTEVVHVLVDRLAEQSAILVFGGLALMRPYTGSTTVSTVNGGVVGLVHTLAAELAPIRVNGLHPGIVGDSPEWAGKGGDVLEEIRKRTPTGRLASMDEVADAGIFLLENTAVNGVNLAVDGGWLLR
jgi:NAD(P)-dependent dehydrogenase (short-subunit alcohol dehydrogenase family)